jgi:chromosome segregation ATPase
MTNPYEELWKKIHREAAEMQEKEAADRAETQAQQRHEQELSKQHAQAQRLQRNEAISAYRKRISGLRTEIEELEVKIKEMEKYNGSVQSFEENWPGQYEAILNGRVHRNLSRPTSAFNL